MTSVEDVLAVITLYLLYHVLEGTYTMAKGGTTRTSRGGRVGPLLASGVASGRIHDDIWNEGVWLTPLVVEMI